MLVRLHRELAVDPRDVKLISVNAEAREVQVLFHSGGSYRVRMDTTEYTPEQLLTYMVAVVNGGTDPWTTVVVAAATEAT